MNKDIFFLLSHHVEEELDKKCFKIPFSKYFVCARCLGVITGYLLYFILPINYYFIYYAVPSLFDVFLYQKYKIHIHTLFNFLSGILLGLFIFNVILNLSILSFFDYIIVLIYIIFSLFLIFNHKY